jgi:hypothetical protein
MTPYQQLFDVKKKIETATPEQMALLQKKAQEQQKKSVEVENQNWWKKRTKLEKGLIIGGSVLIVVGAIYLFTRRKK